LSVSVRVRVTVRLAIPTSPETPRKLARTLTVQHVRRADQQRLIRRVLGGVQEVEHREAVEAVGKKPVDDRWQP
jgi:hypothetical protein